VLSIWEFTAHGKGWNYFLDKIIILVIKNCPISVRCLDAALIDTWEFTTHGKRMELFPEQNDTINNKK
jgi:hypothetical protein